MLKKINFNIIKEKIKKYILGKNKKIFLLVLVLIIAFALISFINSNENNKKETNKNVTVDNYSSSVEQKLERMLLGYLDVEIVDVFVITKGTIKTNYLMEMTETETSNANGSTKTTTSKVVFEKSNGVNSPIVVSTVYPEIVGVMIKTNSISASTKISIKNSIALVLNISEDCISILQEK